MKKTANSALTIDIASNSIYSERNSCFNGSRLAMMTKKTIIPLLLLGCVNSLKDVNKLELQPFE
jgi:hypothetical protein